MNSKSIGGENSLIALALSRPIAVLMCFVALLVMGTVAYVKIPVELLPRGFSDPYLTVFIPYRNSNPAIVEQQVTKPLEEYLSTVRKLREIHSRSSANRARFRLKFDSDTNMKLAYSQVQDRIDRARTQFPKEVGQEFIWKFNIDDAPIMWLGISANREIKDPYHLIETRFRHALIRIEGVARVDIHGMREKLVQIDLDREAVRRHRIDIYRLIGFFHSNNFSLPLGYVREGQMRYFARSTGHFKSLQEIAGLKINDSLRLKDIAKVSYTFKRKESVTHIDGKDAFFCAIYKESKANTVHTCRLVEKFLREELSEDRELKEFKCPILWNQGDVIENSLSTLKNTMMWGAALAVLILLIFLRSVRMTLLITLSIPLSLLIALVVMYFGGESLNILSLTGLTLSVGMLVDNTVVVVENIDRHKRAGLSGPRSALAGASEVGLAVTLSTATTLVVFLPLILMNDNVQFKFFMARLGLPVCFSLVASLAAALVFVPLASTYLGNWKTKSRESARFKIYEKVLEWTITRRFDAALALLLLLASSWLPYDKLKLSDRENSAERRLSIELKVPRHYDLKQTGEVFEQVERILIEHKKDLDIDHELTFFDEKGGEFELFLTGPEKARLKVKQIVANLKLLLPELPGVRYKFGLDSESVADKKISIRLTGPNTETLYQIASEVEQRLSLIPGLEGIGVSGPDGEDEIHLHLARERAFDLGVSPTVMSATIAYALRGNELPRFKAADREISMTVQYRTEESEIGRLKDMKVFSAKNKEVAISTFCDFEIKKSPKSIVRINHKTALNVAATPVEGRLDELRPRLLKALAEIDLPQGYTASLGTRFKKMEEDNKTLLFAFLMSVTFVFFLMGILFESFVLPFSILASIPFALMGVVWTLYLTDTAFEIMAGIGMMILAGVVVNNAIVLIDWINRLRRQGIDRKQAIILAGSQRFRPIMITAITTIVGLLPMAIGKSHIIGVPYFPLARTVIGGLTASTLFTLLAVPLFYTLCDDIRNALMRLVSRIFR